jgi:hypothetical protein
MHEPGAELGFAEDVGKRGLIWVDACSRRVCQWVKCNAAHSLKIIQWDTCKNDSICQNAYQNNQTVYEQLFHLKISFSQAGVSR